MSNNGRMRRGRKIDVANLFIQWLKNIGSEENVAVSGRRMKVKKSFLDRALAMSTIGSNEDFEKLIISMLNSLANRKLTEEDKIFFYRDNLDPLDANSVPELRNQIYGVEENPMDLLNMRTIFPPDISGGQYFEDSTETYTLDEIQYLSETDIDFNEFNETRLSFDEIICDETHTNEGSLKSVKERFLCDISIGKPIDGEEPWTTDLIELKSFWSDMTFQGFLTQSGMSELECQEWMNTSVYCQVTAKGTGYWNCFDFLTELPNLKALIIYLEDFRRGPVRCLQFLDFWPNLNTIDLEHQQISNLRPLADLTELASIGFHDNYIEDLEPLGNLPNIVEMAIGMNLITDIIPIQNLVNLEKLWIQNNFISDISAIQNLRNLRILNLSNNKITDYNPLKYLTKLEFLTVDKDYTDSDDADSERRLRISDRKRVALHPETDLDEEKYPDFPIPQIKNRYGQTTRKKRSYLIREPDFLENLTNLKRLSLQEHDIYDLSRFSKLRSLEYLNLAGNEISDLSPLETLINLRELILSGTRDNRINSIYPLSNLINLEILSCTVHSLEDLNGLEKCESLKSLNLETRFTTETSYLDIHPISSLKQMTTLTLNRCDIKNIYPLNNLKSLKSLEIGHNPLQSLVGLEGLENLETLNIERGSSRDQIKLNLEPLKNLKNLKHLNLNNCGVTDVTPLSNLDMLETINLQNNPVSNLDPIESLSVTLV